MCLTGTEQLRRTIGPALATPHGSGTVGGLALSGTGRGGFGGTSDDVSVAFCAEYPEPVADRTSEGFSELTRPRGSDEDSCCLTAPAATSEASSLLPCNRRSDEDDGRRALDEAEGCPAVGAPRRSDDDEGRRVAATGRNTSLTFVRMAS